MDREKIGRLFLLGPKYTVLPFLVTLIVLVLAGNLSRSACRTLPAASLALFLGETISITGAGVATSVGETGGVGERAGGAATVELGVGVLTGVLAGVVATVGEGLAVSTG